MPETCKLCGLEAETTGKVWYSGTEWICASCGAVIIASQIAKRDFYELEVQKCKLLKMPYNQTKGDSK